MADPSELAGARAAQAALDAWLGGLGAVDPGTPSLLPGWSVGHVLTHLARNADSHLRMLAGEPQYPGGAEQREADIAVGAGRPWAELLADLRAAHERLDAAWSAVVAASLSPAATASRTRRTYVLSSDLTALLRRRAFSFVRMRLIWDLMLATCELSGVFAEASG